MTHALPLRRIVVGVDGSATSAAAAGHRRLSRKRQPVLRPPGPTGWTSRPPVLSWAASGGTRGNAAETTTASNGP